jgi:hypothetical protein
VRAKPPGAGTPTGTIEFFEVGAGRIGDHEALDADGAVTATFVGPAGSTRFRVVYSGDAGFADSAMEIAHETRRADTVTRISSSPNPVAPGGNVDLTITVGAVAPGDVAPFGTVQVEIDGTPVGDALPLEGAEGVRVTLRSSGVPGTVTIRASYSGDDDTNPSSAESRQTVSQPETAAPQAPSAPAAPFVPTATAPIAPVAPTAPASPSRRTGAPAAAALAPARLREMTATLVAALRRGGLRALARASQQIRAPEAGVLVQRVRLVRRAAGRANARRVLLASGRHRFTTAGAATLRLRVTAAGRRLARRAAQRRLEITTSFTPERADPVVVRTRITVPGRKRGRQGVR